MMDIKFLTEERNALICNLWAVLRKMSDIQGTNMTDEDLDLWTTVTNHSGIQSKLEALRKHYMEVT